SSPGGADAQPAFTSPPPPGGGPPAYNTSQGAPGGAPDYRAPGGPGAPADLGHGGGGPPALPPGPSSWPLYPRPPPCSGPIGCNGPIGSEVYARSGIAFPVGGGIFGAILEPGWLVQGGGRVLFFNPEVDAAWTVDLSLSNVRNYSKDHSRVVRLTDVPVRT